MLITNTTAALGVFLKVMEFYDKDPEPIFKKLSLDPQSAGNPTIRIPYAKIEALWLEMIDLVNEPYIGLKVAELWHPSTSGPLGYAWLASSTLRAGFERVVRYLHIITDGWRCEIKETEEEFSLVHYCCLDSLVITQQIEAHLATLVALCRYNYGQRLNPIAIYFAHPAPKKTRGYADFFRCPVYFNATDNRIVLSQSVVDRMLPSSNPVLTQLNDQIMLKYLQKMDKANFIQRIKATITDQLPSGKVTDSSIAEALYLSRRSLHRKLQDETTTFREVLNGVRLELSQQYIHNSHLSLNEISFLLGFSEMSSFSRAFKRWTGTSPSKTRKQ